MLALANDAGATEGERDTAMRHAQSYLTKHNLEMDDIVEKREVRIDHENGGFATPWACAISMQIAKLYFCSYYRGRKLTSCTSMHHFVGKESNATTAALMASFIVTAIKREASKLYGGDTTPGARAFGKGAAYKIFTRVSEMLATGEVEGLPQSTALRVVSLHKREQEENEAFIKGSGTELRSGRSSGGSVDLAAFAKGESFGGEIGLNTQVEQHTLAMEKSALWAEMKRTKGWVRTTQGMRDEMLCCLPPVVFGRESTGRERSFAVGEPDSTDVGGMFVYACFTSNERGIFAKYMNLYDFREFLSKGEQCD
jgi:hypothetical protein